MVSLPPIKYSAVSIITERYFKSILMLTSILSDRTTFREISSRSFYGVIIFRLHFVSYLLPHCCHAFFALLENCAVEHLFFWTSAKNDLSSVPDDIVQYSFKKASFERKRKEKFVVINSSGNLFQVCSLATSTAGHVLGDECNGDWECREDIAGSICNRGRCSCQPFYARVNQTSCVQCKSILNFNNRKKVPFLRKIWRYI